MRQHTVAMRICLSDRVMPRIFPCGKYSASLPGLVLLQMSSGLLDHTVEWAVIMIYRDAVIISVCSFGPFEKAYILLRLLVRSEFLK